MHGLYRRPILGLSGGKWEDWVALWHGHLMSAWTGPAITVNSAMISPYNKLLARDADGYATATADTTRSAYYGRTRPDWVADALLTGRKPAGRFIAPVEVVGSWLSQAEIAGVGYVVHYLGSRCSTLTGSPLAVVEAATHKPYDQIVDVDDLVSEYRATCLPHQMLEEQLEVLLRLRDKPVSAHLTTGDLWDHMPPVVRDLALGYHPSMTATQIVAEHVQKVASQVRYPGIHAPRPLLAQTGT